MFSNQHIHFWYQSCQTHNSHNWPNQFDFSKLPYDNKKHFFDGVECLHLYLFHWHLTHYLTLTILRIMSNHNTFWLFTFLYFVIKIMLFWCTILIHLQNFFPFYFLIIFFNFSFFVELVSLSENPFRPILSWSFSITLPSLLLLSQFPSLLFSQQTP